MSEQLLRYNVFTCVDKSAVSLNSNSNLIVFGDSITALSSGWVENVVSAIGCHADKFAIPGALYGEQVRTSDFWISTQIARVSSTQWGNATLVILSAGTNDAGYNTSPSELKNKVLSAITSIRENTSAPILFVTPIKRASEPLYKKLPYISGIIENTALTNNCSVIAGLFFPVASQDDGEIVSMLGDEVHPNSIGSKVLATSIINAIL
jgi:lysophospholipase L1-like esterase